MKCCEACKKELDENVVGELCEECSKALSIEKVECVELETIAEVELNDYRYSVLGFKLIGVIIFVTGFIWGLIKGSEEQELFVTLGIWVQSFIFGTLMLGISKIIELLGQLINKSK